MEFYDTTDYLKYITVENICRVMAVMQLELPFLQIDSKNPIVVHDSKNITIEFEATSNIKVEQLTKNHISSFIKSELAIRQPMVTLAFVTVIIGLHIWHGQNKTSVCLYFNI